MWQELIADDLAYLKLWARSCIDEFHKIGRIKTTKNISY